MKNIKANYKRRGIPPQIPLDQPGRLRVANLMALFGISHQTLYVRLRGGHLPKPDGYDLETSHTGRRGRPYWFTGTIVKLLTKDHPEDTAATNGNSQSPAGAKS